MSSIPTTSTSSSKSASHPPLAPGAPITSLPPSLQLLHQKQQEHAGLQALKEASEALVARAERMAAMSATMAEGGETVGKVLENWSYIFRLLEEVGRANPNLAHAEEELPVMVRLPYKGERGEGDK